MITEARNSSGQHTDDLKKKKTWNKKKVKRFRNYSSRISLLSSQLTEDRVTNRLAEWHAHLELVFEIITFNSGLSNTDTVIPAFKLLPLLGNRIYTYYTHIHVCPPTSSK